MGKDGGGVRGISSLVLLQEAMGRMEGRGDRSKTPNPAEYFDVIAGSGTGGLSACMIGRLRMSVSKATEEYAKLMKSVFSDKKALRGSGTYKGTKLQQALQSMIEEATGNKNEMMRLSGADGCKTMVFAMSKHNMNAALPVIFRSYKATTNPGPSCTIWEALYATMAHPDLFKSIEIGDSAVRQSFVGGELGCGNPISHVLAEVKRIYPGRYVSCILSLGAGHARTIHIPNTIPSYLMPRTQDVIVMKDMATDNERVAEEMAARFQSTNEVYFRFNVDQGMQEMEAGDWERLEEVVAHTTAHLHKAEESQRLDLMIQVAMARQASVPTRHIDGEISNYMAGKPIVFNRCPAPTPVYTGRHDEAHQVVKCLLGGTCERRVCVIHGLGGVGKTQLALKSIELTRETWAQVVYIDASSREAIEQTLGDFASTKKIGHTYNDSLSWLESSRGPWLLVFDNADDPSTNIRNFIPGCNHGSVLITTRLANLALYAQGTGSTCHLSNMNKFDAQALFIKAARLEDHILSDQEMVAMEALLQDFGYLALAIVHAAAYIGYSLGITVAGYREIFLSQRRRMLEQYSKLLIKVDDYEKTVYTTWRMCYDLLQKDSQMMLWLLTFLHYDRISESIFKRAALNTHTFDDSVPPNDLEICACKHVKQYLSNFLDSNGLWDSLRFLNVMGDLASCSLIEFDRMNLVYNVHVLVQEWTSTVIPQSRALALECTTTLLSLSIDRKNDGESRNFRRELGLHVTSVLSKRDAKLGPGDGARFARIYDETGQWDRKELLELHILELEKQALGEYHPYTLSNMGNLASTYLRQGRLSEAESLQLQVRNTQQKILGEQHPDTLSSMNNLALIYLEQGRFQAAQSLFLQTMAGHSKVHGENHPDTLGIMHNLALTYRKRGQLTDAELLQVKLVDAHTQMLGAFHPDTLSSMSNLASTYISQGRFTEAETLQLRTRNAYKRLLGEEHPLTLMDANNLALAYCNQGRLPEAEKLQVQLLETHQKTFGARHPATLTSTHNLAATYLEQGRLQDAEDLQSRVVDLHKQTLGENHPDTLKYMNSLASTFLLQGRLKDAEQMQLASLTLCKQYLGEDHSTTLEHLGALATTYRKQGRLADAESSQQQIMATHSRTHGERHPLTLTSMSHLALTYFEQGRLEDAWSLQASVLRLRQQVLGDDHRDTLVAMNNLASTYSDLGRWQEAEQLSVRVVRISERTHGSQHTIT
ncbi:kinesin light chain, partial [Rhizoctonia solani 123E]